MDNTCMRDCRLALDVREQLIESWQEVAHALGRLGHIISLQQYAASLIEKALSDPQGRDYVIDASILHHSDQRKEPTRYTPYGSSNNYIVVPLSPETDDTLMDLVKRTHLMPIVTMNHLLQYALKK
jgi:hypothetical protein